MNHPSNGQSYYDLYDDWPLIEASIAQQYGIRIRREYKTMSWSEFKTLVSGLLPSTPLGKIVGIRAEDDKDMLKNFTPDMHMIRNAWRNKQANELLENEELLDQKQKDLELMIARAFGH